MTPVPASSSMVETWPAPCVFPRLVPVAVLLDAPPVVESSNDPPPSLAGPSAETEGKRLGSPLQPPTRPRANRPIAREAKRIPPSEDAENTGPSMPGIIRDGQLSSSRKGPLHPTPPRHRAGRADGSDRDWNKNPASHCGNSRAKARSKAACATTRGAARLAQSGV